MTIKELIQILYPMPDNLQVGRIGHYGEFYPMNEHNFRIHLTIDGASETVLNIVAPNIEPLPDERYSL